MIGSPNDIIPSFLTREALETEPSNEDFFGDVQLRFGEVQRIVYPKDKDSRSKKFIEYDVYVQYQGNKTGVGRMYSGCVLFNPFAGLADKMYWSLRPSNSATDLKKHALGMGSKVLLLCLNGSTTNAVILGGLRDGQENTDAEVDLSKNGQNDKPGRYFIFEFNGAKIFVNDDGELSFTYGGRTNDDGTTDKNVAANDIGTTQTFKKNGSWKLSSFRDGNEEQYILLDHANQKIELHHKKGVKIGSGSDKMLLASTYRKKETEMLNNIKQSHMQMSQTLRAIQGYLQSIATTMKAPNGYLSTGTFFDFMAISFAGLASDCNKVAQDIGTFEAQANSYLSKNNTND